MCLFCFPLSGFAPFPSTHPVWKYFFSFSDATFRPLDAWLWTSLSFMGHPHRTVPGSFSFCLDHPVWCLVWHTPACLEGEKYSYTLNGFTPNTQRVTSFCVINTAVLSASDFQAHNNNQNNKLPCEYVYLCFIGAITLNVPSRHLWRASLSEKQVVEQPSCHSKSTKSRQRLSFIFSEMPGAPGGLTVKKKDYLLWGLKGRSSTQKLYKK